VLRLVSLSELNETMQSEQLSWYSHRLAKGWTIGVRSFDSRRGLGNFLFTTASRPALGHFQPFIKLVPGSLSLGIKRPGLEANHSLPSSAEVKNVWDYTSTSSTSSWHGA